jgi:phosphatidylserine/phosphatidylglycerophosphate/cardiolipin synthase-like enzyme
LAEAIDKARLSVDMAMDDLDLWSLRAALIDAHRRGVTVRAVVESDNLDEEQVGELIATGIPVVADQGAGLMHNKFVIVDRLEVWTGSMNFTVNGAYRSNNNLVRVRSPELAEDYLVEFEEMFVDRQPILLSLYWNWMARRSRFIFHPMMGRSIDCSSWFVVLRKACCSWRIPSPMMNWRRPCWIDPRRACW